MERADRPAGPLAGVRVVELASELAAYAGKVLADLGAEVVLVEPPAGHRTRSYGPFVDDVPGPERSLWWFNYNTSKCGVTLDLDDPSEVARFRRLLATADVFLEAEPAGRLDSLGLDCASLRGALPALVTVSVSPFGGDDPRSMDEATDLTLMAGAGPVWSCGYDDHSLPPVRGGGNQALHTASLWAAMSALVALVERSVSGSGQHVDVSAHAASNVTTEGATYWWLVAGQTVQRQTGRHASVTVPTMRTIVDTADGRCVVLVMKRPDFQALLDWLQELGIRDQFAEAFFLEMGAQRPGLHESAAETDPLAAAIFGAVRQAVGCIAARLSAYDFFRQGQARGFAVSIVNTPEDVLADPHVRSRGFPARVWHEDLQRTITYPGSPVQSEQAPGAVTRAPHLGEHNDRFLGAP